MRFFRSPKNLSYRVNTVIPVLVFLTSILSAAVARNTFVNSSEHYVPWIFGVSIFSSFCSLVIVMAMTQPIKELVKKAERMMKLEETKKEAGQMIEVYKTIEKLIDYVKSGKDYQDGDQGIIKSIEELDYIIPLGYMSLVVAHEIRNPLSTVVGMSELLKEKATDTRERAYIDSILAAAKKMDVFTKELLDFTDSEISLEDIDVNKIIKDAVDSLKMEFPDVTCELTLSDNGFWIADENKMYQTLYNITKNAFEYEKNGGAVSIETRKNGVFTVSIFNRNSLIGNEDIESIFKPFFSRKKGGRGLGLFVALRNVKLHGGEITVKSDEGGTMFIIMLPGKKQGSRSQGVEDSSDA